MRPNQSHYENRVPYQAQSYCIIRNNFIWTGKSYKEQIIEETSKRIHRKKIGTLLPFQIMKMLVCKFLGNATCTFAGFLGNLKLIGKFCGKMFKENSRNNSRQIFVTLSDNFCQIFVEC